jgi:hypothetical protein
LTIQVEMKLGTGNSKPRLAIESDFQSTNGDFQGRRLHRIPYEPIRKPR